MCLAVFSGDPPNPSFALHSLGVNDILILTFPIFVPSSGASISLTSKSIDQSSINFAVASAALSLLGIRYSGSNA